MYNLLYVQLARNGACAKAALSPAGIDTTPVAFGSGSPGGSSSVTLTINPIADLLLSEYRTDAPNISPALVLLRAPSQPNLLTLCPVPTPADGDQLCSFALSVATNSGFRVTSAIHVLFQDDETAAIGFGFNNYALGGTLFVPEGTNCLQPLALLRNPPLNAYLSVSIVTTPSTLPEEWTEGATIDTGFAFSNQNYNWLDYQFMEINATRNYLQDGVDNSFSVVPYFTGTGVSGAVMGQPISVVQSYGGHFQDSDVQGMAAVVYDMEGQTILSTSTSDDHGSSTIVVREGEDGDKRSAAVHSL